MGQTITVSVRPGSRPEVRFFECNRSVTGMAIEVYPSSPRAEGDSQASGHRPPDVLARRLIDLGAQRVTIYSNIVTVEAPADAWSSLEGAVVHAIEHLFEFYGADAGWSFEARGVEPPPPLEVADSA